MKPVVSLLFHDVYVGSPDESGFSSAAADRYKLSLPEFEAQIAGVAGARNPLPYSITVDDGGVSYYTLVADRLEARGWRGHCFVSTDWIGRRGFLDARQIRELDQRGHVIGSHSASHPARFSACSVEEIRGEWARSRQVLEDVLGHDVTLASVPGGYFSRAVAREAGIAGMRQLFTSEPTTGAGAEDACAVIGRFTIRQGNDRDFSRRLIQRAPWSRAGAWASWNAKGVLKPLLGSSYARVADYIVARTSAHP